jgi:gamma-glutamyltranspeptidase/glutathione hydrolase
MHNLMPKVRHAMIATPHYMASAVGSMILQQGGNAFDAAVAVSAALAVVYPHMTGLGGDAFFLMHRASDRKLIGLNGSGRSAGLAVPEYFLQRGLTAIPQRGVQSAITVPGMVDAWWSVWSGFGRLPWERILAPAIRYAAEGVPVSRNLFAWMQKDEALLRADCSLSKTYLPGGKLLQEGGLLVQPELAATLGVLQHEGRDAFYEGKIMRAMIEAIERDGGLLREEDFLSHRSAWVEPVTTVYRGNTLVQMPPNSQGFTALLMMNMLEHTDLSRISRTSADFYHLMCEVVKKAFRSRDRYLTDPDFHAIPLQRLLSKRYAGKLWAEIERHAPFAEPFTSIAMGQDTAYAAVVDEEGNAVSFIQSLYFDFGSAYAPGNTGVILQNRGCFFSLDSSHPNVLAPHKRSFHTLMPGMVLRDDSPFLLCGTQGGEGQPQTTLSLLTGVLDYGCTIQEAIALPRWVYGRTWGEDGDTLKLENRLPPDVPDILRRWGHKVELVGVWDGVMGQAQGIMIDEAGMISGAADPRGDGMAIGW